MYPNTTISKTTLKELIPLIKSAINIESYYTSQLGSPAKKRYAMLTFFCPFHADGKNPNFVVNLDGRFEGRFKCFSCGESGDIISFHQSFNNLNFKEAINDLKAIYLPSFSAAN